MLTVFLSRLVLHLKPGPCVSEVTPGMSYSDRASLDVAGKCVVIKVEKETFTASGRK